ncbi:annexin D3-like [Mercurialis annua]|uniref:annexin D3-like n=1 Tax=Mercurialis annua TaxID=3986 RepID=UPI00215F9B6E|nr:annexin D3-like [Mercurialis annua]
MKKAVILWAYDPAERDARLANEALKAEKKTTKQLQVIVEIACAPSSPHYLQAVRQAYCSLFDCSLEEHIIASIVSPPLRKILVSLVISYRYDKEFVDTNLAKSEAEKLHEAQGYDDLVFILSTRNVYQLRATFRSYQQNFGNPIHQDVQKCGNGDMESLLEVVICCIDSPEKYFSKVIGDSIIRLGTDEDSLIRAIVTTAEIDMMRLRGEYFNIFKTNLDGAVVDDTSGDYQNFLMTLLGANI